ncbi:hypothetical protein IAQ61_006771 [Plenodomus lingam]|uniref:uncharacterized protein n=1 Tax=Leptosphaeria maculans TaxID=5022 RepID=UPI00333475B2|nr:hypothetical protein IAQ61_006771 [Plenodomus lingam]
MDAKMISKGRSAPQRSVPGSESSPKMMGAQDYVALKGPTSLYMVQTLHEKQWERDSSGMNTGYCNELRYLAVSNPKRVQRLTRGSMATAFQFLADK